MKQQRRSKHNYVLGYSALLFTIGLGSAIVTDAAQSTILKSYLGSAGFSLYEIYRAGSSVSVVGALGAVVLFALVTRQRVKRWIRIEAIALLNDAVGRESMPVDYRAAIAYVIQDLADEVRK